MIFLILGLSFLFYSPSLNFFFISDDFYYLSFDRFIDLILPLNFQQHYIPLFLSLLLVIKKIFGLNPYQFHLLTVSVHLINSFLFYILAKKFFLGMLPLIAAAVFTFLFAAYETVFWITGLSLSLMLLFSLLSLNIFLRWLKTGNNVQLILINLFSVFSILSHEYGLMTLFIIVLYLLIVGKKIIKRPSLLFIIPLVLFFLITLWKISSGTFIAPQRATPYSFLATFIKSFTYLLFPFPYLLDNLPKLFTVLLFILLLLFVLNKSFSSRLRLFLFLWLILEIILIAASSLPQARYYYFLSVPAVLLLLSVLSAFPRKITVIYALFIIFQGFLFISEQKVYWAKTSLITKIQLDKIQKSYLDLPEGKKIYLVNFPDSLNGPPWNAYLFRNGLQDAVKLLYYQDPEKLVLDNSLKTDDLTELGKQGNKIIYYYNTYQ